MENIEVLRDHYVGEIWVIGAGKSMNDFPKDFFDDKISIAINYMYRLYPRCTFIVAGTSGMAREIKIDGKEFLRKLIFVHPIDWHSRVHRALSKDEEFYVIDWDRHNGSRKSFFESVEHIMKKERCVCVSLGTTAHPAMQAALVLGAKKVTLVGCDAKIPKSSLEVYTEGYWELNKAYYKKYGISYVRDTPVHRKVFQRWKVGTSRLAEACKQYDIEVSRYYYKEGYVPVEKEKELVK